VATLIVLGLLRGWNIVQGCPPGYVDDHPPFLAGYLSNHPAGQQYQGYWTPSEVQQADTQVTKP
jgi:hypothetical protein